MRANVTDADLRDRDLVALERFGEFRVVRREGSDPSETLVTRQRVEQAKKVLITRLGLSEAEAFLSILERKLSTRRSLRETASLIVEAEAILARVDLAGSLQRIFDAVRQYRRSTAAGRGIPGWKL